VGEFVTVGRCRAAAALHEPVADPFWDDDVVPTGYHLSEDASGQRPLGQDGLRGDLSSRLESGQLAVA
jgi:hypothetical protein